MCLQELAGSHGGCIQTAACGLHRSQGTVPFPEVSLESVLSYSSQTIALHRSVIVYFSQQLHHRSTAAVMHVPVITQFCAPPLRRTFILASSAVPTSSSSVGSRMFSAAQVIGACRKWAHCKDLP